MDQDPAHRSSDPSTGRGAVRRRALALGIVAAIVAGGVGVALFARSRRDAERRAEAERAADAPLRAELERREARARADLERIKVDVRVRPALLPPALDGSAEEVAGRFAAAVAAIPRAVLDQLPEFAADPSDAGTPEEQDQVLTVHPGPLRILREVLRSEGRQTIGAFDGLRPTTVKATVERERALRWSAAAMRRAADRGDTSAALDLAAQRLVVGLDMERTRNALAFLLAIQAVASTWDDVRRVLGRTSLDASAIGEFERIADAFALARPSFADLLEIEDVMARSIWSAVALGRNPVPDVSLPALNDGTPGTSRFFLDGLDELDRVYASLRAAEGTHPWPSEPLADEVRRIADATGGIFSQMHVVPLPLVASRAVRAAARERLVRTAFAVIRYVRATGAPPARLADLAPRFLPAEPLDPHDGRPLRYDVGPPLRLWSVGTDRRDDGGTPSADPDDEDATGTDLVLTLAPPR